MSESARYGGEPGRARRWGAIGAVALVFALCAGLVLELSSARRVDFQTGWDPLTVPILRRGASMVLQIYPETVRQSLPVPAELVRRTVATARFRDGLAVRLARLPEFDRFPIEAPFDIEVIGERDASFRWTLPGATVQRLSLLGRGWVRAEGEDDLEWERRIQTSLGREARACIDAELAGWQEDLRADTELQLEITRRSLAIRRATGDRLRISENWRVGGEEDWDARTARLDGHLAELARLAELVRELPPPRRVHEILLEGTPERPRERRIGAEVDTPEELRDLLARSSEVELRARALRAAEERLEAATGIQCSFSRGGTRPAGADVPDLEALAAGLPGTGLLERDVLHLSYREEWWGRETRASVRIEISFRDQDRNTAEDLSVGSDPTELLAWVRNTIADLPPLSEEERRQRELRLRALRGERAPDAPVDFLVGEREIARQAAIRTTMDAGLWEILDPALPNRVRFEERTVAVTLDGRSSGEIAVWPAETLTERLHEAYAPLHAASEAARRRAELLAERNRLETEALGGAIEIEPDPRVPVDGLERALAALRAALDLAAGSAEPAGALAEPWYLRDPFWKIAITPRESGWGTDGRPGSGFLDRPTRHVLRIPVDATPEMIAAWLAAPPE